MDDNQQLATQVLNRLERKENEPTRRINYLILLLEQC